MLTQLLLVTFVAITMMGWWFPGRTLMVVLPLAPLALTMLIDRLPAAGKALALGLGVVSVAFTVALQRAAASSEVALAVEPFEMSWWLFRRSKVLFPDYRAWDAETVTLTAIWLTVMLGAAVWVTWAQHRREVGALLTRLIEATPRRRDGVVVASYLSGRR
jgi:hypothetical protein